MKKCPFCVEEIQDEAIKCRFCGEFMHGSIKPKTKWYYSTSKLVFALLVLGPFALPFLWLNPRFSITVKIVVSVAVLAVTVVTVYWAVCHILYIINQLTDQLEQLGLN